MLKNNVKFIDTFYHTTSLITQVPVLMFILITVLVYSVSLTAVDLLWMKISVVNLSVIPILYGGIMYLNKKISDANITKKKERVIPFFVITLVYAMNFFFIFFSDASTAIKIIALNCFILSLVLSIITIFWKISIHVAGVTIFSLLLSLLMGYNVLFFVPLIFFIGWVRIKMRCHTLAQVTGGAVTAALTFYALLVLVRYILAP